MLPQEVRMADESSLPITQDAVDAFADKMRAWSADLPIDERVVMQMLLNRAGIELEDEDRDVEGFSMDLGLSPSQAARAKIPMEGGQLEGWSKGPSWARTWAQALPKL